MSAWKAGGVTQACDGLAKRCDEVRPAQVVDVLGSHLHVVCEVYEAMSAAEVAPNGQRARGFARSSSAHPYAGDPTCARLTRRYAAALSRLCDVIASLPVTGSNGPDAWVFVRELALQGVSKPMRTILDLHAGVVVTHNLIRTSSD